MIKKVGCLQIVLLLKIRPCLLYSVFKMVTADEFEPELR
jgi:hypothetical protein